MTGRKVITRITSDEAIRKRSALSLALLTLAVALSAGCTIGPNYFRPKAPTPAVYKEMQGWKTAEPRDQELRGNWWEIYNDPTLNSLEEQVNVSNYALAQAEAQFRQARSLVAQARAAYFPTIDLSASSTRSRAATT